MRPASRRKARHQASHRVIADHLRATSFLIADGVLPSNEGRGYVLRRIMRRAMRHAHLLGAEEPLMHRLVPALVREMGEAYPELEPRPGDDRRDPEAGGNPLPQDAGARPRPARRMKAAAWPTGDTFSGETAFKLYDTYGFPLDLTQDALRARGIGVDTDAFNAAMERQKAEARAAWKGSGEAATETVWFDIREKRRRDRVPRLRDREAPKASSRRSSPTAPRPRRSRRRRTGAIVLNQTPFYGESGGQVGDAGVIHGEHGAVFQVTDTQKQLGDLFVHVGEVETGSFKPATTCELIVDHARRSAIRANHSATHLSTRRCARSWAITSPRRARSSRRTACASTSPTPSR